MSRSGQEEKPAWGSVPAEVRDRVSFTLGSPVARAMRIWGGYGPSPTYRLRLKNGGRAFLKGTYPNSNAFQMKAHEAELRVYRELGELINPWAPKMLGEFKTDEWQVMLLEDLGPKTAPPWTDSKVQKVAHGLAEFHAASLETNLPSWLTKLPEHGIVNTQLWNTAPSDETLRKLAGIASDDAADAQRWLRLSVPKLVNTAHPPAEIFESECLMHLDVRSDNLRISGGRLRLFDWPHACIGPPEFDAAAFAQSVEAEGGPAAETVMRWYREKISIDDNVLDYSLAILTGYFANQAWQPPILGLPRLRSFQKAQLKVCLRWAARRLDLEDPVWVDSIDGQYIAT